MIGSSLTKRVESFVSYVEDEANKGRGDVPTNFYLLEGEREMCDACHRVIAYRPFSNNRHGILGALRCTNFRLVFTPFSENSPTISRLQTLKFIQDSGNQTPLLNIHSLYYTSASDQKKFKLMTECMSHADQVFSFKVCCRDFRAFIFDFKMCTDPFKVMLNTLLLRPYLKSVSDLVVVASDLAEVFPESLNSIPHDFDWASELGRLHVHKNMLRISKFNEKFRSTDTYPELVVVPYTWEDSTILRSSHFWSDRRFPIWCYSTKHGCSLFRSGRFLAETEAANKINLHFEYTVQQTQNILDKEPFVLSMASMPLKDIVQAGESLRKLCTLDSVDDFWDLDVRWNTEVEKTGWLYLISKCFDLSRQALHQLSIEKRCVVIRETSRGDASCIISSLIQLCLDEYCRTIEGFQRLIKKEWCSFGYPFAKHLFGVNCAHGQTSSCQMTNDELAPVFILFLDCVHQLLEQNPLHFEFSQHFLIGLLDLAMAGLSPLFIFNCFRDIADCSTALCAVRLLDANLLDFFTEDYINLFKNPTYCYVHSLRRLAEGHNCELGHKGLSAKYSIRDLNFWTDCFLRYSTPCHILHGGSVQLFLETLNLASEITGLLEERGITTGHFGVRWNAHPSVITSSYPYANESPPAVPELLYALPVKTESQLTPKSQPRSMLELSTISELNTDIRRLSMATKFNSSTAGSWTPPMSPYMNQDRPRSQYPLFSRKISPVSQHGATHLDSDLSSLLANNCGTSSTLMTTPKFDRKEPKSSNVVMKLMDEMKGSVTFRRKLRITNSDDDEDGDQRIKHGYGVEDSANLQVVSVKLDTLV